MASELEVEHLFENSKTLDGSGRDQSLASFIQTFRTYLTLVADRQLPDEVRAKVSPSDIVQDTYLEARRDLRRFKGNSERDVLAWLCQILLNNVRDSARRYQSCQKRKASREVPLVHAESSEACHTAPHESPSQVLSLREDGQRLQAALRKLPKDHRQVILLRSLERRPFAEVGEIMGRSGDAARKLWVRAIQDLQQFALADASRA